MTKQDVIIVDILQDVVNSMSVDGVSDINFQAGRSIQIITALKELDLAPSTKGKKYPLIALTLPIKEERGTGVYAKITIPRIVIATITKNGEGTENVMSRYSSDGTFKTILYPCYNEFFKRLVRSKHIVGTDVDAFPHYKMDNPGTQPIGQGSTDFVDTIEITDLEIQLIQIKNC